MTQRVTIVDDGRDARLLEPETWIVEEVRDVRDLLAAHFGAAPEGLRIFHGQLAESRDVTPADEADWCALGEMSGPFYVGVMPEEPFTISLVVAIALTVVSLAVTLLLRPNIPTVPGGAAGAGSSNNQLSDRTNVARPSQRIEDILGEVRSTPSLLAVPYKVFEDRIEVEYAYMCVGRGAYLLEDVRDDETLVSRINGESAEFFDPNTSPLSGDAPALRIGDPIVEPLVTVIKSSGVNGQTLQADNVKHIALSAGDVTYHYGGTVTLNDGRTWTTHGFEPGDTVIVTGAQDSQGGVDVDLDGTYPVSAVTAGTLTLDDPASINPDWDKLAGYPGQASTPAVNGDIYATDGAPPGAWVGWVYLDNDDIEQVWVNIVAPGNIYKVSQATGKQEPLTDEVIIDVQQIDDHGNPVGDEYLYTRHVEGSSVSRSQYGWTFKVAPPFVGRARVRLKRNTEYAYDYPGQISDEIKWRDLYAIKSIGLTSFGDVTTVHTRTPATPAALGLKERKFNVRATRKIPKRLSGGGFSSLLYPSKSVDDIICFAALDPFIGRRTVGELDVDGIYDAVAAVVAYFGTTDAAEFGYTFDDDQTSFEEAAIAIAGAAFCQASRRGSLIELTFEGPSSDASILFNHRNKVPGSETRSQRFGRLNDYDGVTVGYVDKDDYDAPKSYQIPEDGSATNPKKVVSYGLRNYNQVYWHAWREWNKIRYQRVVTQFTATREASMLSLSERVLVADNVRQSTQDGEVVSQSGLILELSQDFRTVAGKSYQIFLQVPSGGAGGASIVDSIPITAGADARHVVLARAPSAAISVDDANFAKATYWIVTTDDGTAKAFLVSDKSQSDELTFKLTAVNYDARYYQNDGDVPGRVQDVGGNPIVDDSGTIIGAV